MEGEIVNRVANSKLKTIDLEDFYPSGKRVLFDISDWLYEGLLLKEKDFRAQAQNYDWQQHRDNYVALTCSTEAIIPSWAYLLITSYLHPYAKKIAVGNLELLETLIFQEIIHEIDIAEYKDLPVIIKGCTNKPIPESAYVLLISKLQSQVKSLMYGEACSFVPIIKNKLT